MRASIYVRCSEGKYCEFLEFVESIELLGFVEFMEFATFVESSARGFGGEIPSAFVVGFISSQLCCSS